jgi:hypothetical protein
MPQDTVWNSDGEALLKKDRMGFIRSTLISIFAGLVLFGPSSHAMAVTEGSAADWVAALHAAKAEVRPLSGPERAAAAQDAWRRLERRFPLMSDWMLQDAFDGPLWAHVPAGGQDDWRPQRELIGDKLADLLTELNANRWVRMTERVLDEVGDDGKSLTGELTVVGRREDDVALASLYLHACEVRRAKRLTPWLRQWRQGIVFARHYNMGGSHYAYTEGLSDAQSERHFRPGSSLCRLRMEGAKAVVETLLEAPDGVIRDVDVSWDGRTILFAWKKSDLQDDYSLYTMDAAAHTIAPVTGALGHADYEGAFLPNGEIVFNSTRCVQIVDCWWTEVSNLYTCAPDGRFLRRLSFDQVHTNYPTVTEDGRVLYTRWDYNDRGQIFPQGLFQMYPDGTAQMEYYGNTSWFPTTLIHARGIPGTQKTLAVFTGHHSLQAGKLGVLDPSRGRQENRGAQLVAPLRDTPAERIDAYGQEGDLFMYPWPLDERHFLVSYAPRGWEDRDQGRYRTVFGLYFMDMDGRRELLDIDTQKGISAGRMVPLGPRPRPHVRPSRVDYRKNTAVYYVQDVYEGPGLEGIPRGTIKNLRVVSLSFRAAGIGYNENHGPAGGAMLSTPVSIRGGWDVKTVLGRARVHEDGSAMFEVPARTPVYFQALDEKGHAVQTMRTWSTLQPGESFSCVGCHSENKQAAPPLHKPTRAMRAGAQPLEQFYGAPEGFSFRTRIQPILDRNCTSCHNDRTDVRFAGRLLIRNNEVPTLENTQAANGRRPRAFSLLGTPNLDTEAKRCWSDAYLALVGASQTAFRAPTQGPVRWIHPQAAPSMLPPYHTGAAKSPLITMLEEGHQGVKLTPRDLQMIALWIDLTIPYIGDYTEANAWSEEEMLKYNHFLEKRHKMEAVERDNIQALIDSL